MTPKAFRRWRKSLNLSQKEAAQALGLKRRIVQYYEKGERDGDRIEIPKYVRLACRALAHGFDDYHGPPSAAEEAATHPAEPKTVAVVSPAADKESDGKTAAAPAKTGKPGKAAGRPIKPAKAVKLAAVGGKPTGPGKRAAPAKKPSAGKGGGKRAERAPSLPPRPPETP